MVPGAGKNKKKKTKKHKKKKHKKKKHKKKKHKKPIVFNNDDNTPALIGVPISAVREDKQKLSTLKSSTKIFQSGDPRLKTTKQNLT